MRTRRAQIGTLVLTSLLAAGVLAGGGTAELNEAVAAHKNAAPDRAHELRLVDDLAALARKDRSAWLPDFWAAYLLSQVAMSHREGHEEVLTRAEQHISTALTRAGKVDDAPMADLYALQSLVFGFQSNYATERESGLRYKGLKEEALDKAYATDRTSPVVMVMAATDLIGAGGEKTWPQVLAAKTLLEEARRQFEAGAQPRGRTTHFNSEWVRPWLGWVDRMIANGLDAE